MNMANFSVQEVIDYLKGVRQDLVLLDANDNSTTWEKPDKFEYAIEVIDEIIAHFSSHQVSESHQLKHKTRKQPETIDDIFVKKFMDKVIMSETKGYR